MERDWLERQNGLACFIHRFDVFFESAGRAYRAELTGGVHQDGNGVSILCLNVTDVADEAAIVHVVPWTSDCDDIVGGTDQRPSLRSDSNTVAAGGTKESGVTNSRVIAASAVESHRTITDGGVRVAFGVVRECISSGCRVSVPDGVGLKRTDTNGCIQGADVAKKGSIAIGCIEAARDTAGLVRLSVGSGIAEKGECSSGRILDARFVKFKRGCSSGRVF